jgi:lipid-A-disaccharide synthase-like uncharacterized protein
MKRRWVVILEIVLLLALVAWVIYSVSGGSEKEGVPVRVRLHGVQDNARLLLKPDGAYEYRLTDSDGHALTLTPEGLAQRTYRDQRIKNWWMQVLNITKAGEVIWVTIGVLGQVLFTGRMVVQWLASEREKKSVVPPAFWWMSLIGASMLVMYFIWRHDPVGILGQAVGWFVYIRNLRLIYRKPRIAPAVTEDPGPEPELAEK